MDYLSAEKTVSLRVRAEFEPCQTTDLIKPHKKRHISFTLRCQNENGRDDSPDQRLVQENPLRFGPSVGVLRFDLATVSVVY